MEKVENVEILPDGRYKLVVKLGDRRKSVTSLWAKKVTNVDTSKKNGYAFEGEFFKSRGKYRETEIILNPGELAIKGENEDVNVLIAREIAKLEKKYGVKIKYEIVEQNE